MTSRTIIPGANTVRALSSGIGNSAVPALHRDAFRIAMGITWIPDAATASTRLAAMLSGQLPEASQELLAGPLAETRAVMDATSIAILRHAGLDVAAACGFAIAIREIERMSGPLRADRPYTPVRCGPASGPLIGTTMMVTMVAEGVYGAIAPLSHDVSWAGREIWITSPVPETVLAGAVGRPLRDVMSHPVTDPLGLIISSIETPDAGSLILHTDHRFDQRRLSDTPYEDLAPRRT